MTKRSTEGSSFENYVRNAYLYFGVIAAIIMIGSSCCRADIRDAVVRVGHDSGDGGSDMYTGVIVDEKGHVLTVNHGKSYSSAFVIVGDQRRQASIVKVQSAGGGEGIMVLQMEGDVPEFARVATRVPAIGSRVFSIGYPGGTFSHNEGRIVSEQGKCSGCPLHPDGTRDTDFIKVNYKILEGNSGGPLFNEDGHVIGLASSRTLHKSELIARGIDPSEHEFASMWVHLNHIHAALGVKKDKGQTGLMYFYGESCLPCMKTTPMIDAAIKMGHPIIKIKDTDNPMAFRKYKVSSIPTIVAVVGGKQIDRAVGEFSQERLNEMLAKVGAQKNKEEMTEEDWSGVRVIFPISDKMPGVFAGIIDKLGNLVESISEGKASHVVIRQKGDDAAFQNFCVAAGIIPRPIGIVVTVPQSNVGLVKGLIVRKIEKEILSRFGGMDIPVEIVFERENKTRYEFIVLSSMMKNDDLEDIDPKRAEPPADVDVLEDIDPKRAEPPADVDEDDEDEEEEDDKSLPEQIVAALLALLGMERVTSAIKARAKARAARMLMEKLK